MATTKQCDIIVKEINALKHRFRRLSEEEADWLMQNPQAALELFIDAIKQRLNSRKPFSHLSEVIISAKITVVSGEFVAKDKFVINTGDDVEVRISNVRDGLIDRFPDSLIINTEAHPVSTTIYGRKIYRKLSNGSIIKKLGGPEKAETTLAEIYAMMRLQPRGEEGALLTNGYSNIFYIRSIFGQLCPVSILWLKEGWRIGGSCSGSRDVHKPGRLVFSSNAV